MPLDRVEEDRGRGFAPPSAVDVEPADFEVGLR
jgi:hypothetical protein